MTFSQVLSSRSSSACILFCDYDIIMTSTCNLGNDIFSYYNFLNCLANFKIYVFKINMIKKNNSQYDKFTNLRIIVPLNL